MTWRWFRREPRNGDAPSRTPSMRQIQETECGVIALAIVLAHHGAWVPLTDLRQRCQVSEQGVTALALVQAAKHYGLAVRAMRLPADNLRHMQAPVILFWENFHFVVLEGVRGDVAWVNDPARGHRTISLDDLRTAYSGVALIAQPGPEFQQMGTPRQPFRTAIDMVRPGRRWLALLGASVLAESVLLPLTIQRAGDAIRPARDGSSADWRGGGLALAGLLVAGASRRWLADVALDAIAAPTRQRLDSVPSDWQPQDGHQQSRARLGQHELADYPAKTAVHNVIAGIRMTIGVPALVLVIGRIHWAGAPVALAALATPALIQQATARQAAAGHHLEVPPRDSWQMHLGESWPRLRPMVELSPTIIIGMVTPRDRLPAMIVALTASGIAFRLVDASVQAISMLYLLPESIVQLSDIVRQQDVAEPAA